MRHVGSFAFHDKSCRANGRIHAEVFPDPTAPQIKMPVYNPRSGMVNHVG